MMIYILSIILLAKISQATIDCRLVRCAQPVCAAYEELYVPSGGCCEQCRPQKCTVSQCLVPPCDDTCGDGAVCEKGECKPDTPVGCTKELKQCPDGSSVGRDSNNNCEFFACPPDCSVVKCAAPNCALGEEAYTPKGECCQQCRPQQCQMIQCLVPPCDPVDTCGDGLVCEKGECKPDAPVFCTQDAKQCPDGSYVGRDSNNNCAWFPCPPECKVLQCLVAPCDDTCGDGLVCEKGECKPKKCTVYQCLVAPCPDSCGDGLVCANGECKPDTPVFCTKDAKQCPDGSSVGRDSNNNCEFFPCPPDCNVVDCAPANCPTGEVAYTPKGECCEQCKQDCALVRCAAATCKADEEAFTPEDKCCPECRPKPVFCTEDAKQCSDGSYVSRDPDNDCEFTPCPLDCATVLCPQILCALGYEPYTPKGECCSQCRKIDCSAVSCLKPVCGANEELYVAEGECCPKCKTDCTGVRCMKPLCAPFEVAYTEQGECCEQCKLDCSAVLCLRPLCAATEELFTPDGSCCPKCKPIDTPPTCRKGKRRCADNQMVVRDPKNNCKFPKCADNSKACPRRKCRNANGKCERGTYVQSITDPCKENNGGCGNKKCEANYCNGATAVCQGCNENQCEDATGTCVSGSIANCIMAPCQIDNGGCGKGQLCGDNYCNGCNSVCSKCPTDGHCINTLGDCVEGTVWNTLVSPCQINNGGCGEGETCEANYCNGATTACKGTCAKGRCLNPNGICDHQVMCKMDPCQIDNGGCGNKKCKANYCGGCNAVCS